MNYNDVKKYIDSHHICPFCHEKHPFMIHENDHMFVIPARAPYIDDHLLIIPKRHVVLLKELTHIELDSLHDLVDIWTNRLHTKHEAVNLLLRDGLADGKSDKSVNHLHFHLIPDCPIGSDGRSGLDREYLTEDDYIDITNNIKQNYIK